MNIDQIINNIYPLSEASRLMLEKDMSEVQHRKGHILFRAEKIETSIYFIKKGMVRAYAQFADREITFWFGQEGDTALSMKSYVANQKSIEITNWGRKLVERELINVILLLTWV